MLLALARDAGVEREHLEGRARRAVGPDHAGVEAIEDVVDLPLVHVYPLDARRVLLGQPEHVVHRLLGARLRLRQRDLALLGYEANDAAGLRQPHLALDRREQRLGAARAEAVRVRVVVQTPETRLALGLREERSRVTADVRGVQQVGRDQRAAVAARAHDVVVGGRHLGVLAGRLGCRIDLVPRRDVLDPPVLGMERPPGPLVLRARRALALGARAGLAARVLERDERPD